MGNARTWLLAAAAVAAVSTGALAADPKPSPAIRAAVADAGRPPADVARDAGRKPMQILSFVGVKPGDMIAEVLPGGGYYTRILAKAVGPRGHVYAVVSQGAAQRPGGLDAIKAAIAGYPNVSLVVADIKAFAVEQPVDLVWTSENYHDLHNGPTADPAAFNKAAMAALKPGGVYYVEDHAAPNTGLSATSTLHRIDPATTKMEIESVGFVLLAQSPLLANPADSHTAAVMDPAIRGRTDRFAMKFRKLK